MSGIYQGFVVNNSAKEVRVLHQNQSGVVVNLVDELLQVCFDTGFWFIAKNVNIIMGLEVSAHDGSVLGVDRARDKELIAFSSKVAVCEDHGFCRGGCAIVVRSVTNIHAGQLANEALKLKDCLQGALRNFRLVRGIRGVPFATLQDIVNDGRDVMVISTRAKEAKQILGAAVCRGNAFQLHGCFHFGEPGR